MGVISVEQTDRLFWLGRYTERVYTTMRLYFEAYDETIDKEEQEYIHFCERMEIPNIYENSLDFGRRYPFDASNPDSIISNLNRAYDNAIVLREAIGTDTLSYIQLAIYDMQKAEVSETPVIAFQEVQDNILAFWGICDDMIEDENTRNIIKIGKRVERIDLFGRLHAKKSDMVREYHRLAGRIGRTKLHYNQAVLDKIGELLEADEDKIDYWEIVNQIEGILNV